MPYFYMYLLYTSGSLNQFYSIYILREINLVYKAESFSELYTMWEIIFILLFTILGTRNTKIEVETLFIEQKCVGFVPKGSTKNML